MILFFNEDIFPYKISYHDFGSNDKLIQNDFNSLKSLLHTIIIIIMIKLNIVE